MTSQTILSLFSSSQAGDNNNATLFNKHNSVFDSMTLKPLWKPWLTLELCDHLIHQESVDKLDINIKYQHKGQYLRFEEENNTVVDTDGRGASEADFCFEYQGKQIWAEVFYLNAAAKDKQEALEKIHKDYQRIEALRRALPKQEVMMLYGIFGRFTTKQLEMFKLLDNSSRTTYVLDSKLTGSTQVSRLCQMQRAGKPRFLLAAF